MWQSHVLVSPSSLTPAPHLPYTCPYTLCILREMINFRRPWDKVQHINVIYSVRKT